MNQLATTTRDAVRLPLLFCAWTCAALFGQIAFALPTEPTIKAVNELTGDELVAAADPGPPEPALQSEEPEPDAANELMFNTPGPPEPPLEPIDDGPGDAPQPIPVEPAFAAEDQSALPSATTRNGPRELLEMAGLDESYFNRLRDGEPLSVDDHELMLRLVYRVGRFDPVDIARWARREFDWEHFEKHPVQYRTQMATLVGRIRHITPAKPPIEVVDQFDLNRYFLCRMEVGEERRPALVITAQLPASWPTSGEIDERASVTGLFFKAEGAPGEGKPLIFIAPSIAWHPDRVQENPPVNFGMTVLGDLGMDVGLLGAVDNRDKIAAEDREPFYQMLWAVGQTGPAALLRHAQQNLAQQQPQWREEEQQLAQEINRVRAEITARQKTQSPIDDLLTELKQLRLRRAVIGRDLERAAEGVTSIYPLFNHPDQQRGRLVLLQGNARRAVKILVGQPGGTTNSDILARYGIDHYYELEFFTEDSENNPLVVCVRELPKGFPTGDNINEGIRVAAFFFKSWAFFTQKGMIEGPSGEMRKHQQLAPLLVGLEPQWIKPPSATSVSYYGAVFGGLFVLATIGIWYSVWRTNRNDAAFHSKAIAKQYTVEEGESLNDLGLEAETEPDFRHLDRQE